MGVAQTRAVFCELSPTVAVLRASQNEIDDEALQALATAGCRLRELDIGYSDGEHDEVSSHNLLPLLGTHTEALQLSNVDLDDWGMLTHVAEACPALCSLAIDRAGYSSTWPADAGWHALGRHCPQLAEVSAISLWQLDCSLVSV